MGSWTAASTIWRGSRPLRIAAALAALLVVASASAIVAVTITTPSPGPFTGCLAQKTVNGTPAVKGQIYNVAMSATTPLAPCVKGDQTITFSNAKGEKGDPGDPGPSGAPGSGGGGLDQTPCTTSINGEHQPGHLRAGLESTSVWVADDGRVGTKSQLVCAPDDFRYLTILTASADVTISPDPGGGVDPYVCTSGNCALWLPLGQQFTITATGWPGTILTIAAWHIPGCSAGPADATCTFAVSGDGTCAIAFAPAP